MSSITFQTPKGTRDFYPDDMRVQNFLFENWRRICRQFGFEEYEGPTFEMLELYTEKSGAEIVGQLYNFRDKGDRELALRPEITPTLARMVNQKGPSLKLPVKWFSIPRLYRYEKAQKGRLREFFQLNMDIVGTDKIWAEVDLLTAIIDMMQGFGLTAQDFTLKISSRKLLSAYLDGMGLAAAAKPAVYSALDKRAKVGPDAFARLLGEAGLDPAQCRDLEEFFACRTLDSVKERLSEASGKADDSTTAALAELEELFHSLQSLGFGEFLDFDLSVVRGLAYYTGVVFEVYDRAGEMRAIAGGGRYDNLLENLGGRPVSGVGFGMGDVVLFELLRSKGLIPAFEDQVDYFLVNFGEMSSETLLLAQALRHKHLRVAYSLSGGKLKKQLSQAHECKARKVIFVGSEAAEPGRFEVKDLASGEQSMSAFEEL